MHKTGPKIYTKTGDDGTSGLIGGNRVTKNDIRLEAYGTVDELNSWVGLIRSMVNDTRVSDLLLRIQNNLFAMGSKLATGENGQGLTSHIRIDETETEVIEKAMDEYENKLKPIRNFLLPGGSSLLGYCHIARTVCRRAERRIIQLSNTFPVEAEIICYINRLSDFFFVLARKIAADTGVDEISWTHPRG
jgi:cob(I)alamin adenosyltransferase